MAQKRKTTRKTTTRRRTSQATQLQMTINVIGLLTILVSVLAFFNLGLIGNFLANCYRLVIGDAYIIGTILTFLLGGYLTLFGHFPKLKVRWWLGGLLAAGGGLIILSVQEFNRINQHHNFVAQIWRLVSTDFAQQGISVHLGGGVVGAAIFGFLYPLLANWGSLLIAIIMIIAGIFVGFNLPFHQTLAALRIGLLKTVHGLIVAGQACQNWVVNVWQQLNAKRAVKEQPVSQPKEEVVAKAPVSKPAKPVQPVSTQTKLNIVVASETEKKTSKDSSAPEADEPLQGTETTENADYRLPTSELLTKIPQTDQSGEYATIEENSKKLKATLASFGVDVEVKNVSLGPSVTKYELHPAVGVKVSRVVSLNDDLALALAAKDLRIEAPIPGKSLIGIEVPNKQVSTVAFRDVIEAQKPHPTQPLAVPLGRDVSGNLVMCDLAKMPHLLIAGSTGSGKSVAINVMITSLLMNTKPNQVKLILIDPKKVELGVYNGIPHLLTPVVTEPKKASRALHKVVAEMERRYDLFADSGQRNMKGYNQYIQKQNAKDGQNRPLLPFIVVVVDELADLMMVTSNEVEDAIIRLGQMARAAGIHMILATQRPSVDVITGLIKANVPSRIAFAVSSGTDSRTIIDSNGAEKLLGRGDMLFQPMGMNKPLRVQGAFIPDADVEQIVNFIKEQQPAEYDETMTVSDDETQSEQNPADGDDEYYADAVELVTEQQSASVSMLQRRFRIGYNRAARIVDEMEERGVVGPSEGSKPRKVYRQPSADDSNATAGNGE